jgi:hypothetical protein
MAAPHERTPLKVLLSSTAQDLVAYRQVADDTILRLSQQSVAMERFGPLPGTPVEECERLARESDVVVCMVAHRYGFEPEKGRGSITRLEVEAAKGAGKDVLAWIVADDHPWTEKREQALLTEPSIRADLEQVLQIAAAAPSHHCARRGPAAAPPQPKRGEVRLSPRCSPPPHFQGREALVKELTNWSPHAASPDCAWALVAAGGTGKTALDA